MHVMFLYVCVLLCECTCDETLINIELNHRTFDLLDLKVGLTCSRYLTIPNAMHISNTLRLDYCIVIAQLTGELIASR